MTSWNPSAGGQSHPQHPSYLPPSSSYEQSAPSQYSPLIPHSGSGLPPAQMPNQQAYPPTQQSYSPQVTQYQHPIYDSAAPQGFYPPNQLAPPQPPYGAPQAYGQPSSQYGAPQQPPQQYNVSYSQQAPPSPGYDVRQVANVDVTRDAEGLRGAMKGFGTREGQLIQILAGVPDPVIMAAVRRTFDQRFSRDLLKDIHSETSGYFREALEAVARGPLAQDVYNLNDALHGAGTKENVLDDVLLGRSNADIHAIKAEYYRVFKRSLEADVRGDLSLKTERLFMMVLAGQRQEESAPVIPQQLDRDVSELHRATEGTKMGTDQISVCHIFASHSDGQLRAISQEFQKRYQRPLNKVIKKEFSGHMHDALRRMLHIAEDRAMSDAMSLEHAMAGAGTKDRLLVNRVVRLHWDREHLQQVKGAYRHHYKRDLHGRIKGETSGHYSEMLLALVGQ